MSFAQSVLFLTCFTEDPVRNLRVYVFPDRGQPKQLWVCRENDSKIIIECCLEEKGLKEVFFQEDAVLDAGDRVMIVDCFVDALQQCYKAEKGRYIAHFCENIFNEDGFYLLSERFQQNLDRFSSSAPTAMLFRPTAVSAQRTSEPPAEPSSGSLVLAPASSTA
jgi:hypothetical protein